MASKDLAAAHSRRVAALALEIANRLRLPQADCDALAQAALLHHYPPEILDTQSFRRLLADLRLGFPPGTASQFPLGPTHVALDSLRRKRTGAPSVLARIIEAASFFDERFEFQPYEPMTFTQIVDELDWMARDGFLDPTVVSVLGGLPQIRLDELVERVHRLPVFPAVLLRALELTADEDSSFSQIEKIVSADQVLAGRVLQAANSSLYNPVRRIASIPQAISYIGLDACRKVLMAGLMQPLFGSASLRDLWKHSLAMAELTERIALVSGRIDAHEAFLAGLVHDVGRLALKISRREYVADYERLIERGCEPVFAETILCGCDHSAIGAEVLRSWAFPAQIVEAVQLHHRPERGDSILAAALYVAEAASGSNEDLAPVGLVQAIEERLGFPLAIQKSEEAAEPGWLEFLVGAA